MCRGFAEYFHRYHLICGKVIFLVFSILTTESEFTITSKKKKKTNSKKKMHTAIIKTEVEGKNKACALAN